MYWRLKNKLKDYIMTALNLQSFEQLGSGFKPTSIVYRLSLSKIQFYPMCVVLVQDFENYFFEAVFPFSNIIGNNCYFSAQTPSAPSP